MLYPILSEKLYLSNLTSACSKTLLDKHKITHIINVSEVPNFWGNGQDIIKVLRVNILDKPDVKIEEYFDQTNSFIDEAISKGGVVLVHCHAGVSRSATIVLGYLVGKYGMTLRQAYLHVLKIKSDICPNLGFFKALQEYELKVYKLVESSFSVREYITLKIVKIYGFDEEKIEKSLILHNCDEIKTIQDLFSER